MTDKIQVGANVWIRPNRGMEMPKMGDLYYLVQQDCSVRSVFWTGATFDYLCHLAGNCFSASEAAEAAIIKPVDSTPITYHQWVDAGMPQVWNIAELFALGSDISHSSRLRLDIRNYPLVARLAFDLGKFWLTEEAAQAWLDQWNAENAGVK